MSPEFLLDSNVFIQAKNKDYPFDIFPVFWEWLEKQANSGSVATIDMVYSEIMGGRNDELRKWMNERYTKQGILPGDDKNTQQVFGEISNWVHEHYKESASHTFLGPRVADPWLIAKAKTLNATLVSLEKRKDDKCLRKVRIPNVCEVFEVKCCVTIDMLRKLGARFSS